MGKHKSRKNKSVSSNKPAQNGVSKQAGKGGGKRGGGKKRRGGGGGKAGGSKRRKERMDGCEWCGKEMPLSALGFSFHFGGPFCPECIRKDVLGKEMEAVKWMGGNEWYCD